VLISSHITDDLERVADEIAYIHGGRLLFQRDKDELLENMAVLRCSEEEMRRLPEGLIRATVKSAFGSAALVEEPERVRSILPGAVIDRLTLSEMMQIYSGRNV
jgi:ABC-2 type transport system ATP-binding protein